VTDDLFVPSSHVFDPQRQEPHLPGPRYRASAAVLPLHFAAVAIGVARGALDDVRTLAQAGHRRMSSEGDLGMSSTDLASLGWSTTTLRAARALLLDQAAEVWANAERGALSMRDWTGDTAAWIARSCARVVDDCFNMAGTAAVGRASPLQRRLRDVHTLVQHRSMNVDHIATSAARSLGHARDAVIRF